MSNNKDIIVIIFSGYNNRAVVSFIRTLEKNDVCYVVIAKDTNDPIFRTDYKDNIVLTRKSLSLCLEEINKYIDIIKSKFKANQYLVAPSTEALNRFLQEERAALEEMDISVPLSDADVYATVSDKKVFGETCQNNGIAVPEEYNFTVDTYYPFVAKPKKYFAQDGSIHTPFLIFNNEQKIIFLEACDPDDFYFQEYVEGRSIYLLYYFHRNGEVFKFSQENLIQQPGGKSMLAAISSDFHNTSESARYEQLFRKLGFHGLVMVEINVTDDKYFMIEANPRFWGPSQLFVDAGMNFFEAFLHDYGFDVIAPVFQHTSLTRYFWFGGMLSAFRDARNLSFHKGCENELLMNLDAWIQHDIYKRADTIGVFREELVWTP